MATCGGVWWLVLTCADLVSPAVQAEAHAAWRRHRRAAPSAASRAGLAAASRCLLVLTRGQCYSAWNDRKRLLRASLAAAAGGSGAAQLTLSSELQLSSLVLRSFPKAHEAWQHRRWLLREVWRTLGPQAAVQGADGAAGAGETAAAGEAAGAAAAWSSVLGAELALWAFAQPRRPANYHAARHLAACLASPAPPPPPSPLAEALRLSSELSSRCPSDPSVLHCRRAVLRAAIRAAPPAAAQPATALPAAAPPAAAPPAALALLVHEELRWAERHIAQVPAVHVPCLPCTCHAVHVPCTSRRLALTLAALPTARRHGWRLSGCTGTAAGMKSTGRVALRTRCTLGCPHRPSAAPACLRCGLRRLGAAVAATGGTFCLAGHECAA